MVKIGCCGFPIALARYANEFGVVEVQKTFYQLPSSETAKGWRQRTPPQFEFTLKAWQGITHLGTSPTYRKISLPSPILDRLGHFRPTDEVRQAWYDTLQIARILEAKIIVLQCPPGFKETAENLENLERFFAEIDREGRLIALELRAPWQEETIRRICEQYQLIHCVDPFKETALAGPIRYYRLHGSPPGERMYRYEYQKQDFEFLARRIREDLSKVPEVYCLFNNDKMYQDAKKFQAFLDETD